MVTVVISVGNLFFSDWDAALSLADVVEASSVVKYTFDFLCGILMPLTRWSLVGKSYFLYQSLAVRVKYPINYGVNTWRMLICCASRSNLEMPNGNALSL